MKTNWDKLEEKKGNGMEKEAINPYPSPRCMSLFSKVIFFRGRHSVTDFTKPQMWDFYIEKYCVPENCAKWALASRPCEQCARQWDECGKPKCCRTERGNSSLLNILDNFACFHKTASIDVSSCVIYYMAHIWAFWMKKCRTHRMFPSCTPPPPVCSAFICVKAQSGGAGGGCSMCK